MQTLEKTEPKLQELRARLTEINDIESAASLLYWDQATYMPPGGAAALRCCGMIGGMFQGYTLGNLMSAQFFQAALKANPEITTQIEQGDFTTHRPLYPLPQAEV